MDVKRVLSLLLTGLPLALIGDAAIVAEDECWPGFVASGQFGEQVREIRFAEDARAIVVAPLPERFDARRPTLLVLYATPNGNTIEQTLGCRAAEGLDWHFDIQHAAAQVRRLREINTRENIVLVCLQPDNRSWPTWRRKRASSGELLRQVVESLIAATPGEPVRVVLTGHSGGGSFDFGFIDAVKQIPPQIERIAFLDSNYYFSDKLAHGKKLLDWLGGDAARQLVVLAYDDRNIELNGKKVVGPTGGTFRASRRMIDQMGPDAALVEGTLGEFDSYTGLDGRWITLVHPNPKNKILHTVLVGEMNGLLYALTVGSADEHSWEGLGQPRAYTDWVQPAPCDPETWQPTKPAIRERQEEALSGSECTSALLHTEQQERERVVVRELVGGNVPRKLRNYVDVKITAEAADGSSHELVLRVLPDYLAVGSDDDFVRMPLTPRAAQHVADLFGCVLPTRKMVDAIYQQANVKLAPQPLVEEREALATFVQHQRLIEQQIDSSDRGQLIAGIKKDVVISNKLAERPRRVAIYGWHQLDGKPIQPLTTVHVESYVDYSHGVRLVDRWLTLDGQPARVEDVLRDENLHLLLSDEGPINESRYRESETAD